MAAREWRSALTTVVVALVATTTWVVAWGPAAHAAEVTGSAVVPGPGMVTAAAPSGGPGASAAALVGGDVCNPDTGTATRTTTRSVQDWYGSAFDGSTKVGDDTQLSAFIEGGLRNRIEIDDSLDPRAQAVAPFNTLSESSLEWVLASPTPADLPVEANLRAALAAPLVMPSYDAVIDRGTRDYVLVTFETVETGPVVVGPVDDPQVCGADGQTITITNDFVAHVSFFELNVREAAPPPDCSTVTRTVTRSVDDWYGSAFNGTTKVRDATQLSDRITGALRNVLVADTTRDAWAWAVDPFVTAVGNPVDWTLAPAEHLPAEAALRTALAHGITRPQFDPVVVRGSADYLLTQDFLVMACGSDPSGRLVVTDYVADVSFFELNVRSGSSTSCPAKPVPHKPDPHKPGGRKPDPRKPDPHKPDPHKPDPHKPDPHKPDLNYGKGGGRR